MPRVLAARRAALILVTLWSAPGALGAQHWNDSRTMALVTRATERRARQLADTGLADYTATAHGYVTFLAQVGEGFPDPPKIVKADELALEVYWRAPNHSKQWIVGRRDTLLLPTDIRYHRDHLGIVQNNFPNIIRLGEGDEVRDVPHPLSTAGLATYDFAISDSMRLTIPGREIDVYEVKLRPKDERAAAAVGAVYLARDDAQVVRMTLSFTRAALIDRELEDVSIVLENALTEGRFWLPRRQEIEIRRTGTWLDFPARGIIRGRWEICCYHVNDGLSDALFTGPEVVPGPAAAQAAHHWTGAILDSLPPDVRAASEADVRRVQEEARSLIRADALARARRTSIAAPAASDLLRVDRAEGMSLGAGLRRRLGGGLDATVAGRYGFSDHQPKGRFTLAWRSPSGRTLRLDAFREYRDASDTPETSGIRNSIAAQEFGSDYSEPWDVRGISLGLELGAPGSSRWGIEAAYLRNRAVAVAAQPATGRYEPTLAVASGEGPMLTMGAERPPGAWPGGLNARGRAEIRFGRESNPAGDPSTFARAYGELQLERPAGPGTLLWRLGGGFATGQGAIPLQQRFFAGGPVTAPGFEYHQFSGTRLLSQRLEWRLPMSFVRIPLGRWGAIPGHATFAPFANLTGVSDTDAVTRSSSGWYPTVGAGLLVFFDLVRIDVARGLRDGRWTFGVDLSRDFWRVM